MADILLKNVDGVTETYENVEQIVLQSTDGEDIVYTEGTGGSTVQADYAQTDSNEINYIQNRPFYDDNIDIQWDGTIDENSISNVDNPMGHKTTCQLVSERTFTKDELSTFTLEYKNTIDSKVYSYKIKKGTVAFSEDENYLIVYLANKGECMLYVIYEDNTTIETNYNYPQYNMVFPKKGIYFAIDTYDESYVFQTNKISGTVLKQIDEKFLPDSIPTQTDIDTAVKNKVDKEDGKSLSTNDFTNEYKEQLDTISDNYVAKEDGKSLSTNDFTNEYKEQLDDLVANKDNTTTSSGLPDVTAVDNGKIMKVVNGAWQLAEDEVGSGTSNDSNGSYTVTHADYNQDDSTKDNHIQNRPFFEGILSISYDGNYANREYIDLDGIYMVKVSDCSPTVEEIIGSSYEVTAGGGVLTGTVTEDMVQSTDARMYFVTISDGTPIFLVALEDVTEDSITATRGSYIYDFLNGTYTSKFTTANSVLKTIDEKFLPESVKTQPDWDETNESSPAYIKNKPVIGADGSVTVQSNWNQNDSTQGDYIKNRPFYDYIDEKNILEEQGLAFVYNDTYQKYTWGTVSNASLFQLVEGETYTVVWDETEYQCIAETMTLGTLTGIGLGNKNIAGIGDDTGEPFIFAYLSDSDANSCMSNDTAETTHMIRIYQYVDAVKQLDDKYIPKSARGIQPDWNEDDTTSKSHILNRPFYGKEVEILPLTTCDMATTNEPLCTFTMSHLLLEDNNYKVFWDDVEYICPVQKIEIDGSSSGLVLGNFYGYVTIMESVGQTFPVDKNTLLQNDEPFLIFVEEPESFTYSVIDIAKTKEYFDATINNNGDTSGIVCVNHTLKIIHLNIKTLDSIYLPIDLQVDWKYLKNKPFGIIGGNLLEDTTVTPTPIDDTSSGTDYFGYGTYVGLVAGETYTVTFNDKDYILQAQQGESETQILIGYESEDTSEVAFYIQEDIESDGSKVQVVIWINATTCKLQIYKGEKQIKKIPIEYLPDDVGGMPDASEEDEGKFMRVVGGQAVWATVLNAEEVKF